MHTSRLILRPWLDEDLPAFAEMNADPRVMRYFPSPLTAPESAACFDRFRAEFLRDGFGFYAIRRREDNAFLGFTGLHRVGFDHPLLRGSIEIGWRLRAEFWGRGYATEAAQAVVTQAARLGIGELVSFTATRNLPSQRVMQRLGMHFAGTFDHPSLPANHPLQRHVLYRLPLGEPIRRPEPVSGRCDHR